MEENIIEETKVEKQKEKKVKKEKLGVPATVILSIVAALGLIVLFRILYFFFTGR